MSFNVTYTRVNQTIVCATILSKNVKNAAAVIPIVALDASGSMSGSRIANCTATITHMLGKIKHIRLIAYDSHAIDYGVVNSIPSSLYASGNTSFRSAYEKIIKIVKSSSSPQLVIFMTDGEDGNSSHADRAWLTNELRDTKCIIHTIGIDSESHTAEMLALSRCGSSEGTYGYFNRKNPSSYLEEAERLISLIGSSEEISFRGNKYFLGSDPVTIYFEDDTMNCEKSGSSNDEIEYLAYRVNELLRKGGNNNLAEIQNLRTQAQGIFDSAGTQPRVMRKMLRQRLAPIHALITEFYSIVHSNQTITHEKLANLNVAARNARSNRFAKDVVVRMDQNQEIIAKEDAAMLVSAQEMNVEDFATQPIDMSCMLSIMTVPELLRDGDCIGIGIRATVHEACIVDPTLLKIDGISTSNFGCAAFLDAATYSAGNSDLKYGTSTNVVVDSSRNPVSGVLPLYLNPTHWKIAKLYLRRMAGHLCCKDPVLGSNKITFYTYLKAYRYARAQTGEFYQQVSRLLLETLGNIYLMMPKMIPTPDIFCSEISQRVQDVVPSVGLLKVAYDGLALTTTNPNLHGYMTEEILRRNKQSLTITDVCEISEAKWVNTYVAANLPDKSRGRYAGLLGVVTSQYPEALNLLEAAIGIQSIQNEETKNNDCAVPDVNSYEPILTLTTWLEDFLPELSMERRIVISLQACKLPGVTEFLNNYRDLFNVSEEEIHTMLKDMCVEHIKLRRSSELSSVIGNMNRASTSALITELRRGKSLLDRVAILHQNCYIGRNIGEFFDTVTSFEELKMLVLGKYDIAALIGYDKPIVISTVVDIDKCSSTLPKISDFSFDRVVESRGSTIGVWTPSILKFKKLCRIYSKSQLVSLFPNSIYLINKYCV